MVIFGAAACPGEKIADGEEHKLIDNIIYTVKRIKDDFAGWN